MLSPENTNSNTKGNDADEIDLFDVINFFIINRIFILSGVCIGALLGLSYIAYKHTHPITEIVIPIEIGVTTQNTPYDALNLTYINSLFDSSNKDKKNDDVLYYFNEKFNQTNASVEAPKIQSIEFNSTPSRYEIIAKSTQNNINIDKFIESINYTFNKINTKLLVTIGENPELLVSNDYISYKYKLIQDFITTQIELKKLIIPLEHKLETIESPKINKLFKSTKLENSFMLKVLENKTDFTQKDHFKDLIAELQFNQKITPIEAKQYTKKFLDLDRILTNQTAKINNFPLDKFLPSIQKSSNETNLPIKNKQNSISSYVFIFIASLILGGIAGIFLAAYKVFYKNFIIKFKNKKIMHN